MILEYMDNFIDLETSSGFMHSVLDVWMQWKHNKPPSLQKDKSTIFYNIDTHPTLFFFFLPFLFPFFPSFLFSFLLFPHESFPCAVFFRLCLSTYLNHNFAIQIVQQNHNFIFSLLIFWQPNRIVIPLLQFL